MDIQLSERTQDTIRRAVESGKFSTAEAFLEAATEAFLSRSGPPIDAETHADDHPGESALEVAERLGLVGRLDGAPDLSTNPKHLEGFGQSRGLCW